jgi:N-acetylmuramoyl-L-alanine amidase
MLYLRRPMLRGDDVAALQARLNALGFDAGREDGIFGDQTHEALVEFQRNAALAIDGICGPATIDLFDRVGGMAGGDIASVREREDLRSGPHSLKERRLLVAVPPELAALGDLVQRELTEAGADVLLDASGEDDSRVASEANAYRADGVLALRESDIWHVAYFATDRYRSAAGFLLAAHRCRGS